MPLSNSLLKRMEGWKKHGYNNPKTYPVEMSLANLAAANLTKNQVLWLLKGPVNVNMILRGRRTVKKRISNMAARHNNVRNTVLRRNTNKK